jgi:hypothetical protein
MNRAYLSGLLVCVAGLGSTAFAQDLSNLTLQIAPLSEPATMALFGVGLAVFASHLRR